MYYYTKSINRNKTVQFKARKPLTISGNLAALLFFAAIGLTVIVINSLGLIK